MIYGLIALTLTKIALHALAGGLSAEAMGGDFRTGAMAAGANEALVEYLDSRLGSDPETRNHLLTTASQLVGIVAAELVNGDVYQGAEIAAQATRYNYLAHPEAKRLQELNRLLEEENLTAAQRQALEDERLAIQTLSQSRDLALEEACGQGGSAQACSYERSLLRVAMSSWQDVTMGREDRDTVFAEYLHTARQYGQHQQQRMERIGAEALSEMVVDSVNAPIIMGQLVGQALLGDAESQALLREMGQEIQAFADNPLNYITESNREQLAQADALELAGRLDEADRLRIRVALENQSMLMGTSGLVASLPRLARNVVTSRALTRNELIAGLPQGTKITPENVVDIRRLPDGRTVWLETGSDAAGLQHIYKRHEVDFANKGIPREEVPAVIMSALERGNVVGTNGSASVYRISHNGIDQNIAIGVASNGFVVRANPVSSWRPLP